MRLLNTTTLEILEVQGDCTEPYAILSHTWGEEECTLQDMSWPYVSRRKGYAKIKMCCDQAAADGLKWAWVDTCCIDKTSTAELSEAINSMFRWYRQATVCYAYLSDVEAIDDLPNSRWFTRGWTLQELIAPALVRFYSSPWKYLGSKGLVRGGKSAENDPAMVESIHTITGIEREVLETGYYTAVCVARRMAWAAKRETTRIEDRAYSLMGLFDVNMPLMYGEGKRSFLRLQHEILKESEDLSLLAWGIRDSLPESEELVYLKGIRPSLYVGPFAQSPEDFATPWTLVQALGTKFRNSTPPTIVANGIIIKACLLEIPKGNFLVLPYTTREHPTALIGIPLVHVKQGTSAYFTRVLSPIRLYLAESTANSIVQTIHFRKPHEAGFRPLHRPQSFRFARAPNAYRSSAVVFDRAYAAPNVTYDDQSQTFTYSEVNSGVVGAIFFAPSPRFAATQELNGAHRVSRFAIMLGDDGSEPWFAVVEIASGLSESRKTNEVLSWDKMSQNKVLRCVQGDLKLAQSVRRFTEKGPYKEYCLEKATHTPGGFFTKRNAEEFRLLLSIQLVTSMVDYVNDANVLCVDIAGQMRTLLQGSGSSEDMDGQVKGRLRGRMPRLDWQLLAQQGTFEPVLSELMANPQAGRQSDAWCQEPNCLVCSFGSKPQHMGFP